MEVRGPARSGGDFPPGVAQDPTDEIARGPIVPGIPAHPAHEEAKVLEKAVNLLPVRPARTQQVADHPTVLLKHKTRLRFDVGIVACQVIGEEFAVFENRIDRLAQKPGLATEKANSFAIARFKLSDDNAGR